MLEVEGAGGGNICFPTHRVPDVNIEGAAYAQSPSLKLISSRVVVFFCIFCVYI